MNIRAQYAQKLKKKMKGKNLCIVTLIKNEATAIEKDREREMEREKNEANLNKSATVNHSQNDNQ